MTQENPTGNSIVCNQCHKYVEGTIEAYTEHINSNHTLRLVNVKGVGSEYIPNYPEKAPKMLDLPYIGRVRRDAFFFYTLAMILLGILWGKGII